MQRFLGWTLKEIVDVVQCTKANEADKSFWRDAALTLAKAVLFLGKQ